ncbi:substrate-binding domain-containing protein [Streptomyces sp. M10(2022)]
MHYEEGLHIGYRGWLRSAATPAYWFGHGLGYTRWEYEKLTAPATVRAGEAFDVHVRLRNTGHRHGREVVQLYLGRPGSRVERPVRKLIGYTAVEAAPGRSVVAVVRVSGRACAHWSSTWGRWETEPGTSACWAGVRRVICRSLRRSRCENRQPCPAQWQTERRRALSTDAINALMTDDLRSAGTAPTLEDVARAAGVSRATVSRVINGVRNVDPVIQEAVRQAVAVTGYMPNRAARSLVTRRADAIALVVSGAGVEPDAGDGASFTAQVFADPFFGRVVTGVVDFLRPRGIHPVLMFAETSRAREEVMSYLRQGSADGALVVSTHAQDPLPGLITEAGLPAVLYARPARPARISYVDLAHQDGARLAAEHLLARAAAASRRSAVRWTCPRARTGWPDSGTLWRGADIRTSRSPRAVHPGEREAAMERLLIEHPDLDAVFACNDLMAMGACHVLREHGRRVPEDVAVIGFDDSSAASACRPALTTVRQPVEDMAAEMARLLLDRLARPDSPATSVIFEPALVVRDSA